MEKLLKFIYILLVFSGCSLAMNGMPYETHTGRTLGPTCEESLTGLVADLTIAGLAGTWMASLPKKTTTKESELRAAAAIGSAVLFGFSAIVGGLHVNDNCP